MAPVSNESYQSSLMSNPDSLPEVSWVSFHSRCHLESTWIKFYEGAVTQQQVPKCHSRDGLHFALSRPVLSKLATMRDRQPVTWQPVTCDLSMSKCRCSLCSASLTSLHLPSPDPLPPFNPPSLLYASQRIIPSALPLLTVPDMCLHSVGRLQTGYK